MEQFFRLLFFFLLEYSSPRMVAQATSGHDPPGRGCGAYQNPAVWDFAPSLDSDMLAMYLSERWLWSPQTGSNLTAAWRRDASMPPSSQNRHASRSLARQRDMRRFGRQAALRPRSGGGHAPTVPTQRRSGRCCSPRPRRLLRCSGPTRPTRRWHSSTSRSR